MADFCGDQNGKKMEDIQILHKWPFLRIFYNTESGELAKTGRFSG